MRAAVLNRPRSKGSTDTRQDRRIRAFKAAKIVFSEHSATLNCVVRDLSEAGARLAFPSPYGIPETFDLVIPSAPVRPCRVAWRKGSEVGVIFA